MKPKYFYIALSLAIVALLSFNAFRADEVKAKGNAHEKIIKFSHKTHAELTDCQSCHSKAKDAKQIDNSLFPKHDDCKQCHDTENECEKCHYEGVNEAIQPDNTQMLFDHSNHISKYKLECTGCHKGLSEVDYAYKAVQATPPMKLCNECHSNYKGVATNQCEACHVSTANLIPVSHQTVSFKKTHKFEAQKADADCAMCHDNSSCQECHAATNVLMSANTPKNFYAPYSPSNFIDGPKQQQITRAHDLNYVYTHGIDLKGGTTECQTCHQVETFCVECHNSRKADFSTGGITPASHRMSGFIIPGVGSGGGLHATDAKRDIESCQSCHDVQGGDPTCVSCHSDPDGIQGTNPKTHPRNFMKDTKGDWHDSQGSMCFSCHTSTNQPGVGFCGYCHGKNQ